MLKTYTEKEFRSLPMQERKNFTGCIKWEDGSIEYFKNNLLHREDGPAWITSYNLKSWFFRGRYHNLNGPARILPDGKEEYWIHGKESTKEAIEFLRDLHRLKGIKT
jgi:hypothetical protein